MSHWTYNHEDVFVLSALLCKHCQCAGLANPLLAHHYKRQRFLPTHTIRCALCALHVSTLLYATAAPL